jgi:hypothetical protein
MVNGTASPSLMAMVALIRVLGASERQNDAVSTNTEGGPITSEPVSISV